MNTSSTTILVISKKESFDFGCPYCGSCSDSAFSFGGCEFLECRDCNCGSVLINESFDEVFQIKVDNTKLINLIGKHPFRRNSDSIIAIKPYSSTPFMLNVN